MSGRRDFDVLIVGGGLVGAACAALLSESQATSGLKVALIEPAPAVAPGAGEPLDLRVAALSHAASALVREVGAWPALAERRPCAYARMLVWDASAPVEGPDTLVFDAAEADVPDLGHIAENRAVTAALLGRAVAAGTVLLGDAVTGLELGPDLARVLCGERRVGAGLIIAADGADSAARGFAGLAVEASPYPQEAVVAHLHPERPHGYAARQRFLPGGPLALLPLEDGRVSLVWSTAPAHAALLAGLEDAAFGVAVTEASDRVLGTLKVTGPRARFPLRRLQARRYVAERFALVGDAAHTVHPLAGQGVNQGFLDVTCLVAEIGAALGCGEDPGDARALGRYARARRAKNVVVGGVLDGLWHLFADERSLVRNARRTGLGLVNRTAPLKRFFIDRALRG